MMEFTEEFPLSISIIMTKGGCESISAVKVGFRVRLPKCLGCWCLGHTEANCRKTPPTSKDTLGQSMIVPAEVPSDDPSITSQRKDGGGRKKNRRKRRSLRPK